MTKTDIISTQIKLINSLQEKIKTSIEKSHSSIATEYSKILPDTIKGLSILQKD